MSHSDARDTQPGESNRFLLDHARLLWTSYRRLTGRDLVNPSLSDAAAARALFEAPFALLSHEAAPDPILTYGNRTVLDLFELDWPRLIIMPSRFTAEAPNRDERARLLARVAAHGFIDDYSGVRISSAGRRFVIEGATVWNLTDAAGDPCGQAAMFSRWRFL